MRKRHRLSLPGSLRRIVQIPSEDAHDHPRSERARKRSGVGEPPIEDTGELFRPTDQRDLEPGSPLKPARVLAAENNWNRYRHRRDIHAMDALQNSMRRQDVGAEQLCDMRGIVEPVDTEVRDC